MSLGWYMFHQANLKWLEKQLPGIASDILLQSNKDENCCCFAASDTTFSYNYSISGMISDFGRVKHADIF